MSPTSQLYWRQQSNANFNSLFDCVKSMQVYPPCSQHKACKRQSFKEPLTASHGLHYKTSKQQANPELQQLVVSHDHGDGGGGSGGLGTRRKRTADGDDGGHSFKQRLRALQLILHALFPAMILQLSHVQPAHAASRAKVSSQHHDHFLSSWEIDAFVERMWELSGPILNNMGFSGLLGAAAAAALKMAGRLFAASLGVALIVIQVLSYNNVITVNWSVVHEQARQVLDSTDDGRLDADGFKRALKKGLVILSEGVPSVSGFLVGFVIGLKLF